MLNKLVAWIKCGYADWEIAVCDFIESLMATDDSGLDLVWVFSRTSHF
jgi:hypothetical protein